jgi:hypothetical protein
MLKNPHCLENRLSYGGVCHPHARPRSTPHTALLNSFISSGFIAIIHMFYYLTEQIFDTRLPNVT